MNTTFQMDSPLFVKGDLLGNLITLITMVVSFLVLAPLLIAAVKVLAYAYVILSL